MAMFRSGSIPALCYDVLRSSRRRIIRRSPSPRHYLTTLVSQSRHPQATFIRLRRPSRALARFESDLSSETTESASTLTAAQQTAHARLRPIVDTFNAPIDWAVAYGSGVVHQANASPGLPPLTDFLFSTPSPASFHTTNLGQNPSHYPLYARLLGGRALGWLQETWGAGVWYVTMVKIHGIEVKYGVISTRCLRKDLEEWDTLYVAGRLHKPVLPLQTSLSLDTHLTSNHRSALHLSLLLLPPSQPFSELALWEQIAGISYSGDPRMSVPGAENPEKVKNIVRGEGVLEGFRGLYEGSMKEVPGLRWEGQEKGGQWNWTGRGEELLAQSDDTEYFAKLLASLPISLRRNVARHFRTTAIGALVDRDVREARANDPTPRKEVPEDLDFWRKIVEEERFREVVQNELRQIIRRPALTQSIKGLFTAGLFKSFFYSLAKVRKWASSST